MGLSIWKQAVLAGYKVICFELKIPVFILVSLFLDEYSLCISILIFGCFCEGWANFLVFWSKPLSVFPIFGFWFDQNYKNQRWEHFLVIKNRYIWSWVLEFMVAKDPLICCLCNRRSPDAIWLGVSEWQTVYCRGRNAQVMGVNSWRCSAFAAHLISQFFLLQSSNFNS